MIMSQPTRILLALLAGLLSGIAAVAFGAPGVTEGLLAIAEPVGGIWLDALRMTIVPLVVSLLITGIAAGTQAARAGRLTFRAIILFLIVLWSSALLGALLLPTIVGFWPLPTASGDALRAALGSTVIPSREVPGIAAFLRGIVPNNPFEAAASGAMLPLIVFTTVFAFAVTRLPSEPRARLTELFAAVADAMLVVIGWVLWIGPLGVFALAFVVGARAGSSAVGALLHYVIVVTAVGGTVWLLAYAVALFGGKIAFGKFARAVVPVQAVAISTQSSLACLPAMLRSAERLGIPVRIGGVVLPLAVALFRATGPAVNLSVALYIAHWYHIELGPMQIAIGVATAAITTMGAVSLPGQVSFIASIAPIAMAMGVPFAPLALLIAVEPIPDIMRTVGNATMDVAVTTLAARDNRGISTHVADGEQS